jgi:hypothetical protein
VGDDIPVDDETLLMTDFINLKIKSTQYFRCAHKDRVFRVFIKMSIYMCISIYIYTVSQKKLRHVTMTNHALDYTPSLLGMSSAKTQHIS